MSAPAVAKSAPVDNFTVGRPRIPAGALVDEGQFRRRFFRVLPPGMTDEDVRYPETWSHLVRQVVRHDLITLLAADESWELECCVERVLATGVEVSIRKKTSRTPIVAATVPAGDGFHADYSFRDGWHIVRQKDGHILTRNHGSAALAIAQFQREQPKPAAPSRTVG